MQKRSSNKKLIYFILTPIGLIVSGLSAATFERGSLLFALGYILGIALALLPFQIQQTTNQDKSKVKILSNRFLRISTWTIGGLLLLASLYFALVSQLENSFIYSFLFLGAFILLLFFVERATKKGIIKSEPKYPKKTN